MASHDNDLVRQLKQFGVDVGPITDSTRDLYKRKLQRLKARGKPPPKKAAAYKQTPPKKIQYRNSPAGGKSNPPLNSPIRPISASVSSGRSGSYGHKRPAPPHYQADHKRPRLDLYNPSHDEVDSQEDMEVSGAVPTHGDSYNMHNFIH